MCCDNAASVASSEIGEDAIGGGAAVTFNFLVVVGSDVAPLRVLRFLAALIPDVTW